ncbi:protein PLASTID MOVEMENT IMPAIRED 2-like [Zingiber officinale]|nr:protein PLASTID MOVEMENT IMPAIRED 2-like [Zingiber officinale]XP_042416705.1 protein PLASTID MOVEMENT IMPAIRED 2-like [Zingiber officinale]
MERQQTPIFQLDLPSQCVDLLLAEMTLNKLIDRKKAAERETAQLLSELCMANDKAKELAFQIEEAKARAMACQRELSLTSPPGTDDVPQILREVDGVKQKISSLKLDMASASVQRERAQIQIQLIDSECKSYSDYSEGLRREIEATNIEKEFVDLDRSEVEREIEQIKASHDTEAANFSERMEKTKSRIVQLQKEISAAKKMQKELAIIVSDVNALQHEMEFLRSMEKSSEKIRYVKNEQEVLVDLSSLQALRTELAAAKEELSGLKEEGFRIMDAMDVARKEMMQIAEEKGKCNRAVKESESKLEILDTKLHKVMSKMEFASKAERRADAIVSSLSAALRQLHSDIEAAKRETELVREETKPVRVQTEKTRSKTASVEERFGEAMEELKHVTASETIALEELQAVTESTMTERAISALWSDTITISKFEYYYLTKQGKAAQEVAEKKVAAALAWKEALEVKAKAKAKAKAKEEEKKRAKAEDELKGRWAIVTVDQKRGTTKPKKSGLDCNCKQVPEEEEYVTRSSHNMKLAIAMPRRSLNVSGMTGRISCRRPSSSQKKQPSFTDTTTKTVDSMKKKGKIMEKVVRLLNRRRGRQNIKEAVFPPATKLPVVLPFNCATA